MIECQICHKEFKRITNSHLLYHNLTIKEYKIKFPNFSIIDIESKQKISDLITGIKRNNVTKEKISIANKGRLSGNKNPAKRLEVRILISKKLTGRTFTSETIERMSIAHKGLQCGENNPNWKGGIADKPYCFRWTEKLREKIRIRDNRICQNCGKNEIENGQKLSVHHIHYDKENCYPDLITVCRSCNSKVNFNRLYWEYVFMSILTKRNLLNYFGDVK